MKYTPEQKAEALESIEKIGVTKTAETMKISAQTLYKWRSEGKEAQPTEAQPTEVQPTEAPQTDTNTFAAKALLGNDRIMEKTIDRLEEEVKDLRATIVRYRAALAAVLEGDKK